MTTSSNHHLFESLSRVSQTLCNDRCQNILYKAVFEHFKDIDSIAALLLTSESFQNSSFGANVVVNFVVNADAILLLESVLSPSSCFSMQFAPAICIQQSWSNSEKIKRYISNFASEIVKTKYLALSLRSLTLYFFKNEGMLLFFSASSNSWPQLRDLTLKTCELDDSVLEMISKNALQLRTVNFGGSSGITDAGLEYLSKLSNITSLDLTACYISDASLEHISKLSSIISLDLSHCHQISDAGLDHVSKLSAITSLNLHNCKLITDVSLAHIAKLCEITALDLSYCGKITDVGLESISQLASITTLDLTCCSSIRDAGLQFVAKLFNITSLDLSICFLITDSGLEHIAKLSGIKSLNVLSCYQITAEAKAKFSAAWPSCQINGKPNDN